jgi:hypothetical protein
MNGASSYKIGWSCATTALPLYQPTAAPLWNIHRVNSTRQALRQFLEWREEEGFAEPSEQGGSPSLFVEPVPQRQKMADSQRRLLSHAQVLGARPRARVGRGALAAPAQRACTAQHPVHGRSRAADPPRSYA